VSKDLLLSCLRWAAAAALSKEGPVDLRTLGGLLKLGVDEPLVAEERPPE
jgi:hypothetical protein